MADLIRTLEADLFGAHAWAAEFYQELVHVPDPAARALVAQGLLRALDRVERGEHVDVAHAAEPDADALAALGMAAAEALAEAEDAVDARSREVLATLEAPREAFVEDAGVATARAFVEAFRPLWARGPRDALVVDACLAALALSNVVASHERDRLQPFQQQALHGEAAALYEDVASLLGERVGAGATVWSDTVASALNRAARAWRLAGDEERARRAQESAVRLTPAGR